MADEATPQSAVAEPAAVVDAPAADTPTGDTGSDPIAERNEGFLSILEGGLKSESAEVEEPAKPEVKDEPKPEDKPAEKPAAKADLPAEAPQDAEDEDEDDDSILSREEIDKKFSNSPKGLRKYADSLGKKYAPVAAAIEELGGLDAVKRLDSVANLVLSSPSRPDAPEVVNFLKGVRETNPAFARQLNTNVFYGAIDEDPGLLDSVIKLPPSFDANGKPTGGLGPNWSVEKILKLTQLVDAGEIDMEEVQSLADRKVDPDELKRREAEAAKSAASEKRIAELEKSQEETKASERQDAIKNDVADLTRRFSEAREPVWRQFKLLPVDGDPDDVKSIKESVIKEIILETSFELNQNPVFRAINQMVNEQSKGDGYGWAVEKAVGMIRGKSREIALRKQPLFSAYLKTYNQPAAKNATTRRPEPLADGSLASERAPSPTGEAQTGITAEERKAGFQRILETGTGGR